MLAVYLTLAALIVAAAIAAVKAANLIHAAIAVAVGGSALAILFFLMDAPYAGSIQLSVGAGLVSSLFVIAISLTESATGGDLDED